MCATYRSKSRNTDFEQHANKIFTAIREINPEYAEKRAIWELFQNALDIIENNGIIKIAKTDKGFKFEHNGRPFNVENLTGLIKQSSNGKTYGSNQKETGQYGTGFLSTHVYGKKILVSASVLTDEGEIKKLNNFLIDREANNPIELNSKIQKQDEQAEFICDEEQNEIKNHLDFTCFEYIESEESKKYIDNMFSYIPTILPYIFAFNDKLHKVEVNCISDTSIYTRNEIKSHELDLSINDTPYKFSFLSDNDNNLKIVMPQSNLNFDEVPKLFLFYPLMDTTKLGVNFLIHAQEFKPNKERDYLFLKASNEELKNDVETNKLLLNRAFELIIKKVTEDVSQDFLSVLNIHFSENDDDYLKEKKVVLINSLKNLERIKIEQDLVTLNAISYLHNDILSLGESILEAIYPLLSEFYKLPDYKDYIYLCTLVNNWEIESFDILKHKDILEKIVQKTHGHYSKIINKESYKAFVKTVSTDIDLLNSVKAIPNIHDEFKFHKELKKWNIVEPSLINTIDYLNSAVSMTYLNQDFYFLDNLAIYTREDFKDDLNKFNNDAINQLERNEIETLKVDSVKFHLLIETLKTFISLNKITETNKKLSDFLHTVYDLSTNEESITNPTVDLNYDSSFKLLARLYIKTISLKGKEHIKSSIIKLKQFVGILHNNHELKKNLLDKLACYPNQMFDLKPQSGLKLDCIKDEDFKTKYFEITKNEIRKDLLLSDFEEYIHHANSITGVQIGDEIETSLSANKVFFPINDSDASTLPILLDLIQFISRPNSKWSNWLPNLNKVKEEILMYKFQNEKTRLSLFNILSESEDKINLLGELAKIPDLEGLINAGKEKQKEEARKNNHLKHIKEIGLQIQNIIQLQIDSSLAETIKIVESSSDEKLATVEEQNGQDFIIYKSGAPIYYIEVKSRWDSEGIVALSKRQVECCARNKGIYAVVTVNVADYKSRNNSVDETISFKDLQQDVYVNLDLCENFEILIKENQQFETISENTKLIEYRGHIPQGRIKNKGIDFEKFIEKLKIIILS
jgi:hypothetical protein